ncbi:MAG: hypothetical protein ACE5E8_00130 [Acidimicrobiia bacterium]
MAIRSVDHICAETLRRDDNIALGESLGSRSGRDSVGHLFAAETAGE